VRRYPGGCLGHEDELVRTRRPWWQATATPAGAFGLAGIALISSALGWLSYALGGSVLQALSAAAFALNGTMYLVAGIRQVRYGVPWRSKYGHSSWRHL
jgi:hypothetical protein